MYCNTDTKPCRDLSNNTGQTLEIVVKSFGLIATD